MAIPSSEIGEEEAVQWHIRVIIFILNCPFANKFLKTICLIYCRRTDKTNVYQLIRYQQQVQLQQRLVEGGYVVTMRTTVPPCWSQDSSLITITVILNFVILKQVNCSRCGGYLSPKQFIHIFLRNFKIPHCRPNKFRILLRCSCTFHVAVACK